MNRLSFEYSVTHAFAKPLPMLMPCVDGVPFTEVVKAFELGQGWAPTGGYSGLSPRVHCYGSVEEYFLGQSRSIAWNFGKTALLACDCGVPTCWSLMALVHERKEEKGEEAEAETETELESGEEPDLASAADPEADFEDEPEDFGTVRWSAFAQPHRPEWDYSAFGPFLFARGPYLETIRDAEARMLQQSEKDHAG